MLSAASFLPLLLVTILISNSHSMETATIESQSKIAQILLLKASMYVS